MRTLFVVALCKVNKHLDEEYDYIIEVEDEPTSGTIKEQADRIRNRIRALHEEQREEGAEDPQVSVNLDAASPFNAMLINLRIMMKEEEDIEVVLDYPHEEHPTIDDREAQEVLNKLDRIG